MVNHNLFNADLTPCSASRQNGVRHPSTTNAHVHDVHNFFTDPVVKILLLDENSPTSFDYDNLAQLDHAATLFSPSAIRTVENHPCRIRCVALGGYPPPSIEVHVGQRVITAEFGFRHVAALRPSPTGTHAVSVGTVSSAGASSSGGIGGGGVGTRGLRAIDFRSERWTSNFLARAEDDEALMKCISIVPGLKPSVVVAKLHVDCEYEKHREKQNNIAMP